MRLNDGESGIGWIDFFITRIVISAALEIFDESLSALTRQVVVFEGNAIKLLPVPTWFLGSISF